MSWPRATKLRRLARCAAQRIVPASLILLYHRVAEGAADPWSLCVSPSHFAEQLEVLGGRVVRLTQLCAGDPAGGRVGGRVAITFDDGYADALHEARPLLARHDAPATVFVTTGGVEDGRPFWWDELVALFEPHRELPDSLELSVRGERYRFELGRDGIAPQSREADRGPACAGPRARLSRELHALIHDLDASCRREQLTALRAWAGVTTSAVATARPLTREEIVRLAEGGLVEVGAHTVSHPTLSALPASDQEREIRDSQDFLAALVGHPITSFAYPHGRHDATTRRILREAGFKRACTSQLGSVWPGTDALRLPRLEVPDCDGDTFARILRRLGF